MRYLFYLVSCASCFGQLLLSSGNFSSIGRGSTALPPSSLGTNLVAYWRMDETSGTRYDAVGTNNLTDNNTVGYATGLITNCASYLSNNVEYLSCVDSPELSTENQSFAFSCWLKVFTTNVFLYIGGKRAGSGAREWMLNVNGSSTVGYLYYSNAISPTTLNSDVKLSTNEWHLICAQFAASTREMILYVDGTYKTNVVAGVNSSATSAPLQLGGISAINTSWLEGHMDDCGFWLGRILTESEVSNLYTNRIGYSFQ